MLKSHRLDLHMPNTVLCNNQLTTRLLMFHNNQRRLNLAVFYNYL